MTGLKVYQAIAAITAALSSGGIPKRQFNIRDQYFYRSIDDVVNCLSPLLAQHKLCVLPRVLERQATEQAGEQDQRLMSVMLKVAFDLVSAEDGSNHTAESYGEALDPGDKATAKAMTAAYKSAVVQIFCIPTVAEDADAASPRLKAPRHDPAPVEGWEQWAHDIIATIGICESREALGRVQDTHRDKLKAIAREKQGLYQAIGAAFTSRRQALDSPKPAAPPAKPAKKPTATKRKSRSSSQEQQKELANA